MTATGNPYYATPSLPGTHNPMAQLSDPNANLAAAMHRLAAAIEKFNERNAK